MIFFLSFFCYSRYEAKHRRVPVRVAVRRRYTQQTGGTSIYNLDNSLLRIRLLEYEEVLNEEKKYFHRLNL